MGYVKLDQPFAGNYHNFYLVATEILSFLTTEGWTIDYSLITDQANWCIIATKSGLTFKIYNDNDTNFKVKLQIGDSYVSGTTLLNPSYVQSVSLANSTFINTCTNSQDVVFLCSNENTFWIFIDTNLYVDNEGLGGYRDCIGVGPFGVGQLAKYGTWGGAEGNGNYVYYNSYYYAGTFWAPTYPDFCVKTGDFGAYGTDPHLYSGGAKTAVGLVGNWTNDDHTVKKESQNFVKYTNTFQQYNLALLISPLTLYYQETHGITNNQPLGYLENVFLTKAMGLYKAGDIVDYNGHQYLLMNVDIAYDYVEIAFKLD